MEYTNYSRKKNICTNCGKTGHEFKVCMDPVTSFGIINIKIIDDINESFVLKEKFANKINDNRIITSKKYPNIKCSLSSSIVLEDKNDTCQKMTNGSVVCDEIDKTNYKFWYYRHKIVFLMVSRKFSLGFVEFVRGRYDIADTKGIINLFEQMTLDEITLIRKNEYDDILYYFLNRNNENKEVVLNKIYEGKYSLEYCESKIKFNMLKNYQDHPENNIVLGLSFYTKNVKPKWTKPEWGFPKGRREKKTEENLACACREFEEETGYKKTEYTILNKIEPIEEVMTGTNGVIYKHVYYLALDLVNCPTSSNHINFTNQELKYDKCEIGDIMWLTYDEAMSHIRPYHDEKKKILTRIYLFVINSLIHENIIMDL
jgi:8-oxo-dGTP pyrophosphatase MutT (NUDIX family)